MCAGATGGTGATGFTGATGQTGEGILEYPGYTSMQAANILTLRLLPSNAIQ
jgi:hypothetical protein